MAHPRTKAQRDRESAQARGRRLQARLAKEQLPMPVVDKEPSSASARFGTQPTRREQEILAETFIHGSFAMAAMCLETTEQNIKATMSNLYARVGATGQGNAAVLLGWLAFPRGLVRPHRPPPKPVEIPDVVRY